MKQLAIMRGVSIGNRDCGTPVMWFSTNFEHGGALQVLTWERARKVIAESGLSDFKELEGHACYVDVDGDTVKFLGIAKL